MSSDQGLNEGFVGQQTLIVDLTQFLAGQEAVHPSNVQEMEEKCFVPFHGFVVDAVIANESV